DLLVLLLVRPPTTIGRDRLNDRLAMGEHLVEQLGNAEKADDDGDEIEPAVEVADAKDKPRVAGDGITPDGGDEETNDSSKQAFEQRLRRDRNHNRHRQNDDGEHFTGTKA